MRTAILAANSNRAIGGLGLLPHGEFIRPVNNTKSKNNWKHYGEIKFITRLTLNSFEKKFKLKN